MVNDVEESYKSRVSLLKQHHIDVSGLEEENQKDILSLFDRFGIDLLNWQTTTSKEQLNNLKMFGVDYVDMEKFRLLAIEQLREEYGEAGIQQTMERTKEAIEQEFKALSESYRNTKELLYALFKV